MSSSIYAFPVDELLRRVDLMETDCRSSRCRLEVWFDAGVNRGEIELALAHNLNQETPGMAVQYPEHTGDPNSHVAIVYLTRGW